MKLSPTSLRKRLFPILALMVLICAVFLSAPHTNHGGTIINIENPEVPKAEKPTEQIFEAKFYIYAPQDFRPSFTNVTPSLCEYVGIGSIAYLEDTYNDPDTLYSEIREVPIINSSDNENIEWGSVYEYYGSYIVVGRYVDSTQFTLFNAENSQNNTYEETPEENPVNKGVLNCIDDLMNSNLEPGLTVTTEGYSEAGDGGACEYIISTKPAGNVDNIFCIELKNGNYANLVYDSDSILNVSMFGIKPESDISDELNNVVKTINKKVKGLEFNNETYYIDSDILLYSMEYHGKDNTILCLSSGSNTISNATGQERFILDNIEFQTEPVNNDAPTLLSFSAVKSCVINNCIFNGGEIHFNGSDDSQNFYSEITISNCNIYNNTSAKSISFGPGKFKNIKIENTSLTSEGASDQSILSFCDGIMKNIIMDELLISVDSKSRSLILIDKINNTSTISLSNCLFSINADASYPESDKQNIILCSNNKSSTTLNLINNTLQSDSQDQFQSLITCSNDTNDIILIENNDVSTPLLDGLIYIGNSKNIKITASTNTISNYTYFSTASNCSNSYLEATGNTVSNGYPLWMKDNASLNYSINK